VIDVLTPAAEWLYFQARKSNMKSIHCPYLGLFALLFALSMRAQPILISPQNQTIGANSVSNLRILKQTPDGAETVLTVEFSYDGMSGATARIIPVITDKNQPKASAWFGADPVSVGTGHGTVSLRVRFFNDEPGVPPELTTDHVRVMMLSEGGNAIISQGIFSRTIKWGNPNATAATSPPPENQAQTPLQSEEKANAEAKVAEEARLKAIAEEKARQVAEAKRVAEEKAKAEAKAAEEARLRTIAEEKARQEAEAKRIADEKAKAEAKAAEEARLKAIAEEKARQEAEAKRVANEKAKAEAKAAEEARLKAIAEEKARQEAEAKRVAEEKAKAEAKAAEEARLKAIAEEKARQEAEAKRVADEKAKAEAKAAEEARLKAIAEEKARQEAEAKRVAEEKAKAEAKAAEEARLKAIAEEKARQEAEAKRIAEEKAKAAEEARLKAIAEEKARQEAEAKRLADEKARAEAEAKRTAEDKARAEAASKVAQNAPTAIKAAFALSARAKSKVTNVDVVNRNLDRTEMTIAVEYQYDHNDAMPQMGVDVAATDEPQTSDLFSSPLVDIGKSSRNFVMFPVKLNLQATQALKRTTLPTDKVWIYLADAAGQKSYIFQATMLLVWHLPGAANAAGATAPNSPNTLQIESFKQNDLFSGYVAVKYDCAGKAGRLRLRVYDSANPSSADWFASEDIPIKSGPGLQLVRINVPKEAASPDSFKADTVEVQMLDGKGQVVARLQKQTPMNWAKPK
jgi:hypothetical protein